ncbi:hypothetical protein [Vibrio mangrovi]|uniref:Uncharacterized protein n=1 Tax=Vibrio mangrovi TaxID=474394 RepID=A0A1Y6ITE2_9VIBR|nr:hypothetical protein [Vibrio mangrovi]MDW6001883.1 hypothetical protein [Vibrio mangrovi]SMS00090.1 hypothetical protein VIM7927_01331 [Vibrio mangrovi]
MRRIRITRVIWVPSGYRVVRRTTKHAARKHTTSKPVVSKPVVSKPAVSEQADSEQTVLKSSVLKSPVSEQSTLEQSVSEQSSPLSQSQYQPQQPGHENALSEASQLKGKRTTKAPASARQPTDQVASFPDQCNPYQYFLQNLPHYLNDMPSETFVTYPQPEGTASETHTQMERPREVHSHSFPASDSVPDDEDDDEKPHTVPEMEFTVPLTIHQPQQSIRSPRQPTAPNHTSSSPAQQTTHRIKTRQLKPHLRELTGICHSLLAPHRMSSSKSSHNSSIQPSFPTQDLIRSSCHDSTWRKRMRQLLFRLCEATDGRHFAFLTDQPDVEDLFDSGYKVAYKDKDKSTGDGMLARWKKAYSVKSVPYQQLPEQDELPEGVQNAFNTMIRNLIPGIDIFFCDYNLAIEADLPICNDMMETYRSTDFVLFSCEELIGNDPTTQPYMVSYAAPRYKNGGNTSSQHRIYCKTDAFAFCQAIHAIVVQQEKDALTGGHIRTEVDTYVGEPPVEAAVAEQVINRFVEALPQYNSSVKALNAPQTE